MPVAPDEKMAMAAEARQILDLKMGAAFTRYVTLSVRERVRTKGVLSIGPCQTPTFGFVYEREHAIRNFILRSRFFKGTLLNYSSRLSWIFKNNQAFHFESIKQCS